MSNCQTALSALDTAQTGIYTSIKATMQNGYGTYVENTKATSTLAQIRAEEFKLPNGINDKEDPIKGDKFKKAIKSILHSRLTQTWTIIPVMELLFSWKPGQDRWSPTRASDIEKVSSMFRRHPNIKSFYLNQNKAVYDLLYKASLELVNKTLDMLKTTHPENNDTHETMSEIGDGISTIAWIIHYHTAHGMFNTDDMVDLFNYMWTMFKTGSLAKATQKVRDELPWAREVGLQIKWKRTISRIANAVL